MIKHILASRRSEGLMKILGFGLALAGVAGIVGTAGNAVALTAASPVRSGTATYCAPAWDPATVYTDGDTASENEVNYTANWWTQGDDPATHNGGSGSGQPWTSVGSCSGGGGGGGLDCASVWNAGTAYSRGDAASESGVNYIAKRSTQGADPATHNGIGSGQPWLSLGRCSGSGGGGKRLDCASAWNAGTAYTRGDAVSESGVNYIAKRSTQGADPATHNGIGSGQPWLSLGSCYGGGSPPPPVQGFIFSPYKDVTINMDWNTYVMGTAVTGSTIPLVGTGGLIPGVEPNLDAVTLAFATGTCGSENWGGVSPSDLINANIQSLADAGVSYIISTGGVLGIFTCPTGPDLVQFISSYDTSYLVGIDFDIEGSQTPSQIQNLVSAVQYAEEQFPNLRFSFTLATLAASDGSYAGVNSLGDEVINDILAANLQNYTVDLMVMDYGTASPYVCVVANGVCDMGQSAIQAVVNLQHTYGIPDSHIELTPMIGRNDIPDEILTDTDVDTIANYAISNGLAGVHFWSLDRDTPCDTDIQYDSPYCNSLPGTTPLEYTDRFLSDLAQ